MSEPKINVATGFNGGVSVSLRADSAAEFEALIADAFQSATLSGLLSLAGLQPAEQSALATVKEIFPGASVQEPSTIGQPLPQPAAQPAPAAPVSPPNVPYPGNCEHGPRVYVDKPARGRPWRRWECAVPWSPQTKDSRCKPVNVDAS